MTRLQMNQFAISTTLLALLMILGPAACSKDAASQLVGTWTPDMETMRAELEADSPGGDNGFIDIMLSSMEGLSFTFEADGALSISMMGESNEGTYEVTATEGDVLTVVIAREGETETTSFTLDGPDRIRTDMHGQTLVLTRAN